LEKVKWRRRKTQPRGRHAGEEPLRPRWDEQFVLEDVRDDSKLAVDVWNVRDGVADEFFGKVTIVISEALQSPAPAWHELLPGRVQLWVSWTPYVDGDSTVGEPVVLTLPPPEGASLPRPADAQPTGYQSGGPAPIESPTSSLNTPQRARAKLEAQAMAYEEEEFEDDEEVVDVEELPSGSPPKSSSERTPAHPPPAAPEFFEFTHRGGTGNGPKENQDAYFLHQFDAQNSVFGVLDGHGSDHGKIAAWAAANASKRFLVDNFERLRTDPEEVMTECFKQAHEAVYLAIEKQPEVYAADGILVQDVDEEEWPLGYDAADGGTTASIGALIDGRTLIYASAGDSCSLLGLPAASGAPITTELVPEHSPTNQKCWEERLQHTGVHVVFDHPDMFDDQPHNLLPIFTRDNKGGWHIADSTLTRADELGCGLKTERGDRAAVVMTPEDGKFSQMMLGVTRSVGDFYHQTYGVTWRPEVVVKDLRQACEQTGCSSAVLILASDGVWDHWSFDESMTELVVEGGGMGGSAPTTKQKVMAFFEQTRLKGEEAFGDGADNLTGIVAILPKPVS